MKKRQPQKKKNQRPAPAPKTGLLQTKTNQTLITAVLAIAIAVVTTIAFYGSHDNEFVTWDDHGYLHDNVAKLESAPLDLFWPPDESSYVMGNYHPLTMLAYSTLYKKYGLISAAPYHTLNIVLHVLNTLLLFWFIFRLSGRVPTVSYTHLTLPTNRCV